MHLKRIFALALALVMALALMTSAFAAGQVADATVDTGRTGSITIYKYDLTQAEKDGVWDSAAYKSTGEYDENVNAVLGASATATGSVTNSLGNGQSETGYALKGVEFTYLQVADMRLFTETVDGAAMSTVLYGFDTDDALPGILGLSAADRHATADDGSLYYYESDVLVDAIRDILQDSTKTAKKDALETYVLSHGGKTMPATDSSGKTSVSGLSLGLYLVVETAVPEEVVTTTDPFFVSVPMTSVSGGNSADGGDRWIYDITVYPKDQTGAPSLEKTLRESAADTGHDHGSDSITDGWSHDATGSDGDEIEFQIISTLPAITSEATYLTQWSFVDTIQYGIEYLEEDGVTVEIFQDTGCTDKVATWTSAPTDASDMFTVTYSYAGSYEDSEGVVLEEQDRMVISMTEAGLAEINTADAVHSVTESGWSGYTMRVTYDAVIGSDAHVVYGDGGNVNEVALVWARTNSDYYDMLVDDVHVYTYGLDLTKQFSDGNGDMSMVEFVLHNDTDGYYVQGIFNEAEQVWYVAGHTTQEAEATHFTPAATGSLLLYGLEDDTYTMTEVRTADGYALLRDDITIVITATETAEDCTVYETQGDVLTGGDTIHNISDALGVVQNDVRWEGSAYSAMTHLSHHLLQASATVDGNAVTMEAHDGSADALVPMTVVNTRTFGLPSTGGAGNWLLPCIGIAVALCAGAAVIVLVRKGKDEDGDGAQA